MSKKKQFQNIISLMATVYISYSCSGNIPPYSCVSCNDTSNSNTLLDSSTQPSPNITNPVSNNSVNKDPNNVSSPITNPLSTGFYFPVNKVNVDKPVNKILFLGNGYRDDKNIVDLMLLDLNSKEKKIVTKNLKYDFNIRTDSVTGNDFFYKNDGKKATLSNDGKKVTFVCGNNRAFSPELCFMDIDNINTVEKVQINSLLSIYKFSSDSKKLFFIFLNRSKLSSGELNIGVLDISNLGKKELYKNISEENNFVTNNLDLDKMGLSIFGAKGLLSPDNTKLIFGGNARGFTLTDFEGKEIAENIILPKSDRGVTYGDNVDWSPDSKKILFTAMTEFDPKQNKYIEIYKPISQMFVSEPDGKNSIMITTGGDSYKENIMWSPDGTNILYISSNNLHVIDLFTGKDKIIKNSISNAYWSPDGSQILLSDKTSFSVVDKDGSNLSKILENTSSISHSFVSWR